MAPPTRCSGCRGRPLHPDLITTTRHTYEDWQARSYDDMWQFKVRAGVECIRLKKIGYADEAKQSYEVFRTLREQGIILKGTRFLVAYPLTESGVRAFVSNAHDYEVLWEAYNEVVRRELELLTAAIPHEDFATQWDLARETMAIEGAQFGFPAAQEVAFRNALFEIEQVEQLALIARLPPHHHPTPSPKTPRQRNHSSSRITSPFSTASTLSRHAEVQ